MGESQHQKKVFAALFLPAVVAVVCGLALPLSNNCLPRAIIEDKSGDPRFAEVSKIMQTSCIDCHSDGLMVKPIYFDWPLAKQVIGKDISKAQSSFNLSREQLSGAQPIASVALAKIASAIQDGSMPPAKYTLMHWSAALSREQKQSILGYIQGKQEDSTVAPAAIMKPNPFHPDPRKASLGERLFNDKRLSCDNSISCATCHSIDSGGCDQQAFSTGIKGSKNPINTPTVFNCAFSFCQFWDGRARDLNEQVGISITDPNQMGASFATILSRLKNDTAYSALSRASYGGALSESTIKDAIATYEKTLLTPYAPFDRYLGGDSNALSEQEKRGYQVFMEKGCASCHAGVALGGSSFEKMGQAKDYFDYRQKAFALLPSKADDGRFNVTHKVSDEGKFKVPSLRNIELTAPYFHDATAKNLAQAVETMAIYQVGAPLASDEKAALVSFLKSLTGRNPSSQSQRKGTRKPN